MVKRRRSTRTGGRTGRRLITGRRQSIKWDYFPPNLGTIRKPTRTRMRRRSTRTRRKRRRSTRPRTRTRRRVTRTRRRRRSTRTRTRRRRRSTRTRTRRRRRSTRTRRRIRGPRLVTGRRQSIKWRDYFPPNFSAPTYTTQLQQAAQEQGGQQEAQEQGGNRLNIIVPQKEVGGGALSNTQYLNQLTTPTTHIEMKNLGDKLLEFRRGREPQEDEGYGSLPNSAKDPWATWDD